MIDTLANENANKKKKKYSNIGITMSVIYDGDINKYC